MSRKKNKKSSKTAPSKPGANEEERSSVAVTVAWMLATFACAIAEVVWLVTAIWVQTLTVDPSRPHPLSIIPDMMRLIAVSVGLLSLTLLPVVLRVRQSPPPPAITAISFVIASAPLVFLALRAVT